MKQVVINENPNLMCAQVLHSKSVLTVEINLCYKVHIWI